MLDVRLNEHEDIIQRYNIAIESLDTSKSYFQNKLMSEAKTELDKELKTLNDPVLGQMLKQYLDAKDQLTIFDTQTITYYKRCIEDLSRLIKNLYTQIKAIEAQRKRVTVAATVPQPTTASSEPSEPSEESDEPPESIAPIEEPEQPRQPATQPQPKRTSIRTVPPIINPNAPKDYQPPEVDNKIPFRDLTTPERCQRIRDAYAILGPGERTSNRLERILRRSGISASRQTISYYCNKMGLKLDGRIIAGRPSTPSPVPGFGA